MNVSSWLATAVMGLVATSEPSLAAKKDRVDVATALRSMVAEACERTFGEDEGEGAVGACLERYLDPATESNERLWLEGHEGDQVCLLNGGVLAERMPACVDAMAGWMEAERSEDLGATFRALGSMFQACVADELCAAGE